MADGVENCEGCGPTGGPIQFNNTYTNFAVAIKAGSQYSLYHFMGSADAFAWDLSYDIDNGNSHWTLYTGDVTEVPEPGTMLLLGTGLLGMAMIRRREGD